MMKKWKKLSSLWKPFSDPLFSVYASAAAHYWTIAAIPTVALLFMFTVSLPITQNMIKDILLPVLPEMFARIIEHWPEAELQKVSPILISTGAATAIWSASKAVMVLTEGLNSALAQPQTEPFLKRRLKAIAASLLLGLCWVFLSSLLMLGDAVMKLLMNGTATVFYIFRQRIAICWIAASVLFGVLYRVLPDKKPPNKYCMAVGCVVSAVWILFTKGYSLYIRITLMGRRISGGIALVLLGAFWLKLCMQFVLYGGRFIKLLADGNYPPLLFKKRYGKNR